MLGKFRMHLKILLLCLAVAQYSVRSFNARKCILFSKKDYEVSFTLWGLEKWGRTSHRIVSDYQSKKGDLSEVKCCLIRLLSVKAMGKGKVRNYYKLGPSGRKGRQ